MRIILDNRHIPSKKNSFLYEYTIIGGGYYTLQSVTQNKVLCYFTYFTLQRVVFVERIKNKHINTLQYTTKKLSYFTELGSLGVVRSSF